MHYRLLMVIWPAVVIVTAFSIPASAQTAPTSYTTATRYDAMGRVTGTISPDPDGSGLLTELATRIVYNAAGRVDRVESGTLLSWQPEAVTPANWTGFTAHQTKKTTYDVWGKVLSEAVSGSTGTALTLTQYSYDARGLLECVAVRMNSAVYAALPVSACTQSATGPHGQDRITRKVYDAAGQLLKVQKAVGVVGLEEDYATYTYSLNGKQLSITDARGYKAGFTYDGFDRQVAWTFPSKTTTTATLASCNIGTVTEVLGVTGPSGAYVATDDCEKYFYDRNGNRARFAKRDGSVLAYQYDALNRNTVKTVAERTGLGPTHTRDIYYSYDLRGLMLQARFDSLTGEGITTAYDGFGRIKNSTITMDGVGRTLSHCYDANGNRTRLGYPDSSNTNGDCAASWTNYVSYTYDGLNRPKTIGGNGLIELKQYVFGNDSSLKEDWTGNMAWGSTLYGRDPIGRMSSMYRNLFGTATDYTTTYAYNPASQVTQESRDNDAYAWTAHANVDRNYATNGLNQYTQVGASPFCHDPNGNLTADGSFVYLYDVENRLAEKRDQGVGNTNCVSLAYTGTLRAALRYDPMGRLYETVGPVTGTTRFLIDGDAMVGEYSVVGTTVTMTQRYVHGADGKADDPIARYAGAAMGNGNLWFMHADRRGSINAIADTIGNPARLFKFDEYGIPQSGDATALTPANGARFLYTGQAWLPDLGMYYYKARIYSPTLGRFMQTDPIGYKDQVNLYAYVANDPVNHVDPTGLSCTQNKDGAYACKVDSDPAGLFKGKGGADRLAMANKAYTAATNTLAARPNQTIKVTVGGKAISVKSGELAKTLAGANVTTANNSRSSQTTLATGSGGALCASCRNVLSSSTPSLTIYSKSFDFSRGSPSFMARDMMDTFMHESIHMHPTAELPYAAMYASDPDKFNRDHQGEYESAIAPIMRTIP